MQRIFAYRYKSLGLSEVPDLLKQNWQMVTDGSTVPTLACLAHGQAYTISN